MPYPDGRLHAKDSGFASNGARAILSDVNVKTIVTLGAVLAAMLVRADVPAQTFDRYDIILQRKPFGDLPPPVVEPPKPAAEPVIAKFYRLCSIVKEDDGMLRVGIVDTRGNKFVQLSPGQSENGLTVVEADYEKETATLQLGEEIQHLELRAGTTTPAAPGQAVTAAAPGAPGAPPPAAPGMSYAERRRQRMLEQHEPAAPPQPKYTGEALQKHLQDYQMEVIRQGLPPLPIPLTPEQDTQLQKEGLLPPPP